MNLSLGIVGLPNVGKSTLFNLLTKISVSAENYPFCTIEPNVGIVEVLDDRIPVLAKIVNTNKLIYPVVEFVDIAGLVKGAHSGEGLGNKFLANIRNTNAIIHVIRDFPSKEIAHVENEINPCKDKEIVETELILKDLESVEDKLNKLTDDVKRDKTKNNLLKYLFEIKNVLEKGHFVHLLPQPKDEELHKFRKELFLITDKPTIYLINIAEVDFDYKEYVEKYKTVLNVEDDTLIIPMNVKQDMELSMLTDDEKEALINDLGIKYIGLDYLIKKSYELLNLITFFTAGEKEVRGWTIYKGMSAREAAGVIHTDFFDKFIMAEVVDYHDFVRFDGWIGAKENGKIRNEGKEYIVKDGDVIIFKHGA